MKYLMPLLYVCRLQYRHQVSKRRWSLDKSPGEATTHNRCSQPSFESYILSEFRLPALSVIRILKVTLAPLDRMKEQRDANQAPLFFFSHIPKYKIYALLELELVVAEVSKNDDNLEESIHNREL